MKSGKWLLLLRFKRLFTNFYRLCFLASIADGVMLERMSRGPVSIENLTAGFSNNTSVQHAMEAWIELGVMLEETSVQR